MRNLASRSAGGEEVKALIEDSVSRVDTGSVLVEAPETMTDIVSTVTRVTVIMGIASASDEQSRGIDQVAFGRFREMDRVTQRKRLSWFGIAAATAPRWKEAQASRLTQAVSKLRLASPTAGGK